MFSICLPSCPQYCSLSWALSHHSSPLTGVTISLLSKPFSQRISHHFKLLFYFTPLPLRLISRLAFLSFRSPPSLSPTHLLNQSFPSDSFPFSSRCFHVSNFTLPVTLSPPSFLPASCLSWPASALCSSGISATFTYLFITQLFHPTGSVFIFSSILRVYHLFPLLDSLPSLLYFPSSVYS